jgi:hypothetical protein
MKPKFMQQKAILVSNLIKFDPKTGLAIISEEVLDDVIRNIKKITEQKNFVPNSPTYNHGVPAVKGMLTSACVFTTQLINSEKDPLETDKYGLLNACTNSFGKHNALINSLLVEIKNSGIVDQEVAKTKALQQATEKAIEEGTIVPTEAPEVPPVPESEEQPFTDSQLANIKSNPNPDNPESNIVYETTQDGGRFKFDKENYEITVFLDNGMTRIIELAPEGSWRRTIIKWLEKLVVGAVVAVVAVKDTIASGWNKFTGLFKKKEKALEEPQNPVVAEEAKQPLELETVEKSPATE